MCHSMKHDTKILARPFFLRKLQIPLFFPPAVFWNKIQSENKNCLVLLLCR